MHDVCHWRMKRALYRLEGNRCNTCGALHFPQRIVCSICRPRTLLALAGERPAETDMGTIPLPDEGEKPKR